MPKLYVVTNGYTGDFLGYVDADSRHDAIVRFHDLTGSPLASLVAIESHMNTNKES